VYGDAVKRVLVVAALLAGCKQRAECGDAIDANFARRHAARQTEAREYPDRRESLEAAQRADDASAPRRRAFLVDHCVDDHWKQGDRECIATGTLDMCLDFRKRQAIAEAGGSERVTELEQLTSRMCACTNYHCADAVDDDYRRWVDTSTLVGEDIEVNRMAELRRKYADCNARALSVTEPVTAQVDALPAECARYISRVDKLSHCERMPQAARDALRTSLDSLRQGLDFSSLTGEARKTAIDAAENACKQAGEAIDQAAQGAGCSLDP